jgi:hypothetical protein
LFGISGRVAVGGNKEYPVAGDEATSSAEELPNASPLLRHRARARVGYHEYSKVVTGDLQISEKFQRI